MGRYDGTIDAAPVCVSLQFCFCLASVLQYLFADPYLQEQSNKAFYQPFWEEQAIPMCTCVISSSILHRVLAHFGKWKCGWCVLLSHSCMNKLSLCNCFSNFPTAVHSHCHCKRLHKRRHKDYRFTCPSERLALVLLGLVVDHLPCRWHLHKPSM